MSEVSLEAANLKIETLQKTIRELKRELAESSIDDLTRLMRRKMFVQFVEEEILLHKRSEKAVSLFVIDLNNLKTINDTHGHPVGDEMLVTFSKLLKGSLRDCDILARTGGDEFMVLLPDQNEENAGIAKKRLLQKLEAGKNSLPFFFGAAIGVATISKELSSFEKMYAAADKAMYDHKKEMKGKQQ